MEPILKTIAKTYTQRYGDVTRFCFIFPNKRCGIYLKKYFAEQGKRSDQLPHILTISEFATQIAKKTEASRIVQLFTLFNAYKEIVGSETQLDFDTFRGWGETVLSDFNTVDLNLTDPEEIFKNIKDYRELTSNFLTQEQKEVMREYFGVETDGDSSNFWKSFSGQGKPTELQQKFLNLWQILAPLHKKFISSLSEKGLGSSGSIYREAARIIEQRGKKILPYNKIVAVGFNALSESERTIFKSLQNEEGTPGFDDYIDFIWDATGPVLTNKDFSASRFIEYNIKQFPFPEWILPVLEENSVSEYPEIEIISSPSVTAQAKVAGKILSEYTSVDKKKLITDAEVALVLPDETLLSNILYALPEGIGEINLTMGYSLRQTSISAFMYLFRRLYASSRETPDGNVFFMKELKMLLSHPYSYILFDPQGIEQLLEYGTQFHKIRLNIKEIEDFLPVASEFLSFPPKEQTENNRIFEFVRNLLKNLILKISANEQKPEENQDISQIKIYGEYVDALEQAVNEFSIQSSSLSLLQMAEKLVAAEKIGFEGEPLIGLQVMGTLETRSLDFRHVIIMSMNEGIMPRKAFGSTFIPETLRKAYGLPPARYAEEIFSYYFYRLISRAEKVSLIYDGRSISGMRGGESRYLLQLRQYAPKYKIREEAWQYRLQAIHPNDASIEKTPEIFEMIANFSKNGKEGKNFSASSLNTYRECEVKFFLENILNLNSDPEKGEYMDAISIGNVLHQVMMQLYIPAEENQKKLLMHPKYITKEFLSELLESTSHIKQLVEKNIQEFYYGDKEGVRKRVASGVTDIISDQIVELIKDIIRYDLNLAPFKLYGCEISENLRIRLTSGREINFRFAIDRLDEINYNGVKRLRIVDYKTGSKKRKAKSLDEVFEGGYGSEQIFQLFTYAWLLGKKGIKGCEDVMTEIYYVPDLVKGEGGLPELDKQKVESFSPFTEIFNNKIENLLESIFEDPKFKECQSISSCKLCGFRSFCSK
ncbi:MAG: PD-(D/E)XK nuclease family protein [Muribaculaceae bacterium]|nr:PD-(D/E)XK nuclease family protein [Muribaculaceae bacterium]